MRGLIGRAMLTEGVMRAIIRREAFGKGRSASADQDGRVVGSAHAVSVADKAAHPRRAPCRARSSRSLLPTTALSTDLSDRSLYQFRHRTNLPSADRLGHHCAVCEHPLLAIAFQTLRPLLAVNYQCRASTAPVSLIQHTEHFGHQCINTWAGVDNQHARDRPQSQRVSSCRDAVSRHRKFYKS
jgi:hypothetical protein